MENQKKILPETAISHFYGFTTARQVNVNRLVIPDGSADIIFSCDRERPKAIIAGSVKAGADYVFQENGQNKNGDYYTVEVCKHDSLRS